MAAAVAPHLYVIPISYAEDPSLLSIVLMTHGRRGQPHELLTGRHSIGPDQADILLNPRISITQTVSEQDGQLQIATPLGSDNGQRSPRKSGGRYGRSCQQD